MYNLPGDSEDYYLLTKGVELSANTSGLCCEIGLRAGGGSKYIIDAIATYCPGKTHIAIDPYGNIPYEHKEGDIVRLDYNNEMRNECLYNLYGYCQEKKVNFQFFNLEDTEFFKRYADGVPVYDIEKRIENQYSFIHFDAAHAVYPLAIEMKFFLSRMNIGGCWGFDDIEGYYNHDEIEQYVLSVGFKLIEKTHRKALYQL